MNTDLFGNSFVEPMRGKQIPLFHEPVTIPVTLPGTTAADRRIENIHKGAPTGSLLEVPAPQKVPATRRDGSPNLDWNRTSAKEWNERAYAAWEDHVGRHVLPIIQEKTALKWEEFHCLRVKIFCFDPKRALDAVIAAGYGDWCGTESNGVDCVEIVCMNPWKLKGMQ